MSKIDPNYIPYNEEWEKEMMKLPKKFIIDLLKEAKTGAKHLSIIKVETLKEANMSVEGIINDLVNGNSTKEETMALMGEYTAHIMHVFFDNAKKIIKENPEILEQ